MNLKKALEILKLHSYQIYKLNGKYYQRSYSGSIPDEEISKKEIIKKAKIYTSSNNQNTAMKSGMKEFRHRNNRAQTKQDIHRENFDSFSKNKLRKDENSWNWD